MTNQSFYKVSDNHLIVTIPVIECCSVFCFQCHFVFFILPLLMSLSFCLYDCHFCSLALMFFVWFLSFWCYCLRVLNVGSRLCIHSLIHRKRPAVKWPSLSPEENKTKRAVMLELFGSNSSSNISMESRTPLGSPRLQLRQLDGVLIGIIDFTKRR